MDSNLYSQLLNRLKMFWKKKSPIEKLQKQYEALQKEAFELSKIDRKKSDEKQAEAEEVMKEIERMQG